MVRIGLLISILCLATTAAEANMTDAATGLSVPGAYARTSDPPRHDKLCGSAATSQDYVGHLSSQADLDRSLAELNAELPGARRFDVNFGAVGHYIIARDGSRAVVAFGAALSFIRFTPALYDGNKQRHGSLPRCLMGD